MTIKEILQKAKINEDGTLDEGIISELDTFVSELVELKVTDRATQMLKEATQPVIDEARETLVAEYEQKFEDFKDLISNSFSSFVDKVLDEELTLPEELHEWARKGQRYADLIEDIRTRVAVDEGSVNEEAHTLIVDAKNEIVKLRDELNKTISENIEMRNDAEALAANLYLRKKCDGLSEAQRSRIIPLLENERDTNVIDEKFTFIMENVMTATPGPVDEPVGNPTELGKAKSDIQAGLEKECKCPTCGKIVPAANNVECSMLKCPDCDNVNLANVTNEPALPPAGPANEGFGVNESLTHKAATLYAQYL